MKSIVRLLVFSCVALSGLAAAEAGTTTWDGRYDTSRIEVTAVYFVPADRPPLPDWRDRIEYFCKRIERFHEREFQTQSTLSTVIHPTPFVSRRDTDELRAGDANAIYARTLSEVDHELEFAKSEPQTRNAFPILLVFSEINWRPLDDFYRLHAEEGELIFEGSLNAGQHFPGAASGGARAAYLADRGVGWGLVSADGWRVPYRGSDCVVYHEGCGHTVGLPHPEPGNGSVMSFGQYQGWLSESWLDKDQKSRLGWEPARDPAGATKHDHPLFTRFRALPEPIVPTPGEEVRLNLDWPTGAAVESLRVRFQTAIGGPWLDVCPEDTAQPCPSVSLGRFDRETPVSYRVDVELQDGQQEELWGYFQVRAQPDQYLVPRALSRDLHVPTAADANARPVDTFPETTTDLLSLVDPEKHFTVGDWSINDGKLESPKRPGARIELPHTPPSEYQLTAIIEPLDPPNALLFGLVSESNRFVTLFGFRSGQTVHSAIENINGRNLGNETTFTGNLFQQHQLSQVIARVTKQGVQMSVDGHLLVRWQGEPSELSLSDYWKTPNTNSLFLGAYDCRYRIHRLTLEALDGGDEATSPKPPTESSN